MFSHIGKARTPRHNLGIASLLSFVAGLVNVVGFFSVQRLTTNVTGHFAFFIDEFFKLNFENAFHFALFVFFFLLGAFLANFMVETYSRIRESETYILPIIAEAMILAVIAFTGNYLIAESPDTVAFSLLFAMGMQNSLVTSISRSIVRTTHLTGLFTDMGIELSQLFFYKDRFHKRRLLKSIRLRITIILMFFIGGVTGGLMFESIGIKTLLAGTFILLGGLSYDYLKIKYLLYKQRK